VRVEPVELCSLIEISDGSLAAIGVVLTVYDMPYYGMVSLIKTETFLPLPTSTPNPTPISSIPGFPLWTIPLVLTILVAAGLLVYHKKHKHKNSLVERHPMRQFVFVPLLEHNVP